MAERNDEAHEGHKDHQRMWKFPHELDGLALKCEQHHLQTRHVDGLPDWNIPKDAAGVPSIVTKDAPANFAWHDAAQPASAAGQASHAAVPVAAASEQVQDLDHVQMSHRVRASDQSRVPSLEHSNTPGMPEVSHEAIAMTASTRSNTESTQTAMPGGRAHGVFGNESSS